MTRSRYLPFVLLVVATLAISTSAILVRMTHTPSLIVAFYRQAFSAAFLLPFVQNEEESVGPRQSMLLILSGLFLALHFATWITGLSYTTVARATLFVDLQPIWAALLGGILLKERLTKIEIAGVLIVTLGGIITIGPHWSKNEFTLVGDVLCLIGGITGAGYFLIGRKIRNRISWTRYMYSVYYISSLWLLAFCVFTFRTLPVPDMRDIHWIVLMALIPSLAGHGLYNVVVRRVKVYVVNAAFLGEPILATLLAYLFLSEQPDMYFYFGATIVFAGLIVIFSRQTGTTGV